MALRDFIDSNGTAWTAWDIPPAHAFSNRRREGERRVKASADYRPERRTGGERRRRAVPERLLYGWLCFESNAEKRRLVPPPQAWAEATDQELEALCRRAVPQPKAQLE